MDASQMVRSVVDIYRKKIKDDRIYFSPDIPYKKLANVQDSYARGAQTKSVLILIDTRPSGTLKTGLFLLMKRFILTI